MKQITLNIKDSKFQFFMEIIKNFDFVQVDEKDTKKEILENIKQGFKEMKMIKEGKLKATSAKDFLDEL